MSLSVDDLDLMEDGTVIVALDGLAYQKGGSGWWATGNNMPFESEYLLALEPLHVAYRPSEYQ